MSLMDFISNSLILVFKSLRYQCCFSTNSTDTCQIESLNISCFVNLTALEENFCLRYEVSIKFLLNVNDTTTCKMINRFQIYIDNVIKYLNYIYYYFSHFVNLAQLKHISDKNLVKIAAFNTNILHDHKFDYCSHLSDLFDFYHKC